MTRHRLASIALALVLAAEAHAASLTPPNLVTASSLNNQDLLLVWPYAAGGPLEAMSWSTFTAQMQSALGASFLTRSNNLSDLANQTTARTNLGLGTAATTNTGTSGSTVCLLNSSCTVSGTQTYTAEIFAAPSSATRAGLNVSPGAAPSSPSNGDVWTTSGGIFAQVNGATQQLAPFASGSLTPTLAYQTPGTSSFSYATEGGAYICVGGFVSGWARVSFTPTNGTASGNLLWNNLPYPLHNSIVVAGTGIGPAMSIGGTWSGLSGAYGPGVVDNTNVDFVNQSGTTTAPITASNSTSGSTKALSWYFTYQNNTGTC